MEHIRKARQTAAEIPSTSSLKKVWPFAVVFGLLALTGLLAMNLAEVPFHPDESTLLMMSADFEQLWRDPLSLAWTPEQDGDPLLRYRGIDAPLARYGIGLGRWLSALPAPQADWDWSLSWEANRARGALPSAGLLSAGRLFTAGLIPLALVGIYLAARQVTSARGALAAAIFLGSNALTLLHARRAMAEGPLLLAVAAFLASLALSRRFPWLTGLAAALAFNAKHSALALLPVGLLAIAWGTRHREHAGSEGHSVRRSSHWTVIWQSVMAWLVPACQYLAAFAALTLALNPFLWKDPLQAASAARLDRQELLDRQVADFQRLAPEQVLDAYTERAAVLLAHLFLTPPLFSETGNYRQESAPAEQAYLANPLHRLWRGPLQGGLLLALTLVGLVSQRRILFSPTCAHRLQVGLLLLASALQFGGLVLAVPLPWQRYSLPLLPLVSLWAGVGFDWIAGLSIQAGVYLLRTSLRFQKVFQRAEIP